MSHPLTDGDRERIAQNKQLVEQHLPELVPFIKELYAKGAVEGWRCVQHVALLEQPEK